MSGLVIASIIVGVLLLISIIGFIYWYNKPTAATTQPGLSIFGPPVDPDVAASLAVQQQVQPGSYTPAPSGSTGVSEAVTPPPPPAVCDAVKCNAAMKNMIITRNSAFGPASPYKNSLAECANCAQSSYSWRGDTGLSISKDGTSWTGCGTQAACYDAIKLSEGFIGEPYYA